MIHWKRVSILLLILLMLSGLIIGYCYLLGDFDARQHITYNITNKVIEGDPTLHGQIYEVMIMPGVDEETVQDALKLVSNQYGFTIVPYDPARVHPSPWNNFDYAPFPCEDESYLIVMVPRDDYPTVPAAGWTLMGTGRITVLVDEAYPAPILAGIIEHECTHNIEDVNKLDYPKNVVYRYEFNRWLSDTWYGSEMSISNNTWSLLRNRWEIDTYLSARSSPQNLTII